MQQTSLTSKRRQRGGSIVEVALMAPWIFFLFVGVLNFGFYCYAAICTQNAARAAALASAEATTAYVSPCTAALGEMRMLSNIGYAAPSSLCSIVSGAGTVTNSIPVNVCIATLTTANTQPCGLPHSLYCADCQVRASYNTPPEPSPTSILAAVTYQTIPLVPIPGILRRQLQRPPARP